MCSASGDSLTRLLEMYKSARELHLHQDNIRFTLLKFYFVLFLGVLAGADKVSHSPPIQACFFVSLFILGLLATGLFVSEHVYFMRYKNWLVRLERAILKREEDALEELSYANSQELRSVRLGIRCTVTLIVVMLLMANSLPLFLALNRFGVSSSISLFAAIALLVLLVVAYLLGVLLHDRGHQRGSSA